MLDEEGRHLQYKKLQVKNILAFWATKNVWDGKVVPITIPIERPTLFIIQPTQNGNHARREYTYFILHIKFTYMAFIINILYLPFRLSLYIKYMDTHIQMLSWSHPPNFFVSNTIYFQYIVFTQQKQLSTQRYHKVRIKVHHTYGFNYCSYT